MALRVPRVLSSPFPLLTLNSHPNFTHPTTLPTIPHGGAFPSFFLFLSILQPPLSSPLSSPYVYFLPLKPYTQTLHFPLCLPSNPSPTPTSFFYLKPSSITSTSQLYVITSPPSLTHLANGQSFSSPFLLALFPPPFFSPLSPLSPFSNPPLIQKPNNLPPLSLHPPTGSHSTYVPFQTQIHQTDYQHNQTCLLNHQPATLVFNLMTLSLSQTPHPPN